MFFSVLMTLSLFIPTPVSYRIPLLSLSLDTWQIKSLMVLVNPHLTNGKSKKLNSQKIATAKKFAKLAKRHLLWGCAEYDDLINAAAEFEVDQFESKGDHDEVFFFEITSELTAVSIY